MTRVTMADVARAAGVNKGTVSRALRGDRRISNETRERIWRIARDLGYEPDAVASGLSSRRTGVAAVVVERLNRPWTGAFLAAAAGVLSRFKMEVLLFEADTPARTRASIVRRVESRKADGLIWLGEQPLEEAQFDIPVVRVGSGLSGANFRVDLDRDWTAQLVRSLCGDRRVVYRGRWNAAFAFLADLERGGDEPAFTIWDGVCAANEHPALICGGEELAAILGVPCLRFPARELGVLAARLLTNAIRDSGVRPVAVLARPPLLSAAGEPVLPNGVQTREKGVQ